MVKPPPLSRDATTRPKPRGDARANASATAPALALPRAAWLVPGLVLVLAVAISQWWLVHDLATLPSPIFGGDYSYQMGCIESIRATGNPMCSCGVSGALPGYLPLYGALVAAFTSATGQSVVQGMLSMAVILKVLATLDAWFVLADLFGAAAGLGLVCVWVLLNAAPILKYTDFTAALLVPLYFHALARFLRAPGLRGALYLGLVLAAAGYSHPVVFVGGILIAVGASVFAALGAGGAAIVPEMLRRARFFLVVAACAALALGYWYAPIFVHHGRTSLHYTEWNGGVSLATLEQRLAYSAKWLLALVRLDQWPTLLRNALLLPALALCFVRDLRTRFWAPLLAAATTLLYAFHFFATMPLLHTHFVPDYVFRFLIPFASMFVAALPLVWAFERLRDRRVVAACLAAAVVATLVGILVETRETAADPLMQAARVPLDPGLASLRKFVLANTKPDDVVLSSNELSFAWSALSGRKSMVARRAQNDPFIDMDVRNKDAAIVLYGDDQAARERLLRQYGVRWLLWTDGWVSGEFAVDAKGNVGYSDPLLYFRNEQYDAELQKAGVKYNYVHGWIDPLLRGTDYASFDLTIVSLENYQSREQPWKAGLNGMLQEAWSYAKDGKKIAVLYRVRS